MCKTLKFYFPLDKTEQAYYNITVNKAEHYSFSPSGFAETVNIYSFRFH